MIFQPEEEGISCPEGYEKAIQKGAHPGGGAMSMIQEGALEDVDMCFAFHVDPIAPIATLKVNLTKAMASCDKFTLEICGSGGHGAIPDSAIDPIGALSSILAAYNQYPSRELSALDNCVVTVGTVTTDRALSRYKDVYGKDAQSLVLEYADLDYNVIPQQHEEVKE